MMMQCSWCQFVFSYDYNDLHESEDDGNTYVTCPHCKHENLET